MKPCPSGKTRYRDELAARMVLAKTRAPGRRSSGREERRAYRCWQCAGWHLSSKA